ncbi:MAG: hypothetical protein AAFS10_06385, partial [Myxococcota bacterium]
LSAWTPRGQVCSFDTRECIPSSCFCDEESGGWICTEDCGGGVCVPDDGNGACEGPNPAGCRMNGCPAGQICTDDPNSCVPSGCSCDEESGGWLCTSDCGGGVCVPDDGSGACETDDECRAGAEWCEEGQCTECDNSGLFCDLACQEGYTFAERNGCTPCECVPINECTNDRDCEQGVCEPGPECLSWCPVGDPSCCYGNTCSEPSACEGPNPEGCVDTGCPRGQVCSFDTRECVPSSCFCDEESGTWGCTDDCGGGGCVPDEGGSACETDNECRAGAEWCEEGECVECDNSGQLCLILCPAGYELQQRNGCTPCACVPINECTTDRDCERGVCEPGPECLSWCPEGDPSCCYGNTCSEPSACEGPNPEGCVDTGCPRGQVCSFDTRECVPSSCFCDEESGTWGCTDDCGGGVCVPDDGNGACEGPNPAGCQMNGCPDDQICSFDEEICVPSGCSCDGESGTWICTSDCNGGICVAR